MKQWPDTLRLETNYKTNKSVKSLIFQRHMLGVHSFYACCICFIHFEWMPFHCQQTVVWIYLSASKVEHRILSRSICKPKKKKGKEMEVVNDLHYHQSTLKCFFFNSRNNMRIGYIIWHYFDAKKISFSHNKLSWSHVMVLAYTWQVVSWVHVQPQASFNLIRSFIGRGFLFLFFFCLSSLLTN